MKTVDVKIPGSAGATYAIRIGTGLLKNLGEMVREAVPGDAMTIGVVTDTNVRPLYGDAVMQSLSEAGYQVIGAMVPAGEQHKNLGSASAVMDTFLNARIERGTPLVALGGGVVGDLTGFVAATVLRGVPFVQVPTTLLSAVDASVGGKVGVDHAAGKNLIGAFHQPRLVVTDIGTFESLPEREVRCGLAECIKHGVIRDAGLFAFIAGNVPEILRGENGVMAELVARNVAIKAAVVEEDPYEKGVRALLNLGHTFGHAIENVMGYEGIGHGEAVGLGMVAAALLAVTLKKFSQRECLDLVALIEKVGLPIRIEGLDVEKTFAAMWTDKKVKGGKMRLILPTKIGAAEVVSDVPEAMVMGAIAALRK